MTTNSLKKLASALAGFGLAIVAAAAQIPAGQFNSQTAIYWDWPTNFWQTVKGQMQTTVTNPVAWPALTNLTYRFYGATTLSGTNTQWQLLATVVNPPAQTNLGYVYYSTNVPLLGAQTFYTGTCSNSSQTSFFSGLAATAPPAPSQNNLQIPGGP